VESKLKVTGDAKPQSGLPCANVELPLNCWVVCFVNRHGSRDVCSSCRCHRNVLE